MKPSEVLEKYELGKGWFALTENGAYCCVEDTAAVALCVAGAVKKAFGNGPTKSIFLDILRDVLYPLRITEYNDDPKRTKEEVIAKLKEAEEIYYNENQS